jgi:hypothetical protein
MSLLPSCVYLGPALFFFTKKKKKQIHGEREIVPDSRAWREREPSPFAGVKCA